PACHAPETETFVERFLARHRVQHDLSVPRRKANQAGDNLSSEPVSLATGVHGDVADVGAIAAIGQGPAGAHQPVRIEGESAKHAVSKHQLKIAGRLVAERSSTVERGDLAPIDAREIVGPDYWHSRSLLFLVAGGLSARGRHRLDDLVCLGKVRPRTFGDGLVADLDLEDPAGARHELGLDTKALAQQLGRGLRALLVAAGPAIDD